MAGPDPHAQRYTGPFRWLRRVDDAVFAVEQAIVATFLITMSVMVFFDVVYRRLAAPDSKVGAAIAALAGVDDPATRQTIDAHIAPWVGGVLGVLVLWFGFSTAQRHKGESLLPIRHGPLVLALATSAVLGVMGWIMVHPEVESRYFYVLVFALVAGAWVVQLVRARPPGWKMKLGALLVVIAPGFVYIALQYFPEGYTWSKELSLIMLLWVGFLGASVCAHEGRHLRMEAFDRMLPEAVKPWLPALGFLGTAAFCAFMGMLGYIYVFDPVSGAYALGGAFPQTRIPDWVAIISVPIAFVIAMLRFIAAAVSAMLGGSYGLPAKEGSLSEAERAIEEGEVGAASEAEHARARGEEGPA